MEKYICAAMFLLSTSQNIIHNFRSACLFILSFTFDIRLYKHTDQNTINNIVNKFKRYSATMYDDEGSPLGIIIDCDQLIPSYIAYNSEWLNDNVLYILCSRHTHDRITSMKKESLIALPELVKDEHDETSLVYRTGTYDYFTYKYRSVHITYSYTTEQERIASRILSKYHDSAFCVSYVYGNVGTGKTMLSYLLTHSLNGTVCETFNPTEPSDNFDNLYSKVNPTKKKPLIVLLDEIDVLIEHIHLGVFPTHKKYPVQIYNKTTWNLFFDKINMGLYPNVIVVLCSNIAPSKIDALDKCYLRNERVHIIDKLTKSLI